jgi:DNA polymerase-4
VNKHLKLFIVGFYYSEVYIIKINDYTYNLFEYEADIKKRTLTNQIQKLRSKYGIDIIKSGFEIKE